MGNLLYLVHRLPFPPNKGDKVRSYHLLKHLVDKHRVYLGTFIDDPDDMRHIEIVRQICPDLHIENLNPTKARLRSISALLTKEPLSLSYYRDANLQAWVSDLMRAKKIDAIVIFSSVMAQYVLDIDVPKSIPILVDFVDVDSAKWTQYATNHRWPLSWFYRREGRQLLAFERKVAARADRSFFVTDKEAKLFLSQAPESAHAVETMENGVDSKFFSPDLSTKSPFISNEINDGHLPIVFTGAMDYWPNIDAVTWFANEILPELISRHGGVKFYIVGRSPPAAVLSLAGHNVVVTGTVPDVRPYLQFASVVVAPLRVARGIQNKILEAMAMSRPVVASQACVEAINACPGEELIVADTVADFSREISSLLGNLDRAKSIGHCARQRVLSSYSWAAHLTRMDRHLNFNRQLPETT